MKRLLTILILSLIVVAMPLASFADENKNEKSIDPKEIIFEHLGDRYGWEVPFTHSLYIPLPIIVRGDNGDWHFFSSRHIEHNAEYEGFKIASEGQYKGKVVGTTNVNGTQQEYRPLDLSITKNVFALFISAFVVILCCWSILRWYKRNPLKAPRKGTALMEVIVEFIYLGVIRSTLGDKAKRFGPYLLTVFFFIFIMNILGLIVIFPGGANLTGNIAITLVLAICTFVVTNIRASKHYWKEIFWPDVPIWLKFPIPIMQVIEVFGIFTKPAALTVRLFANMMGGHMIVITLTLLIFIFAVYGVAIAGVSVVISIAFSAFMMLLDILISFIQAYVFTMLSTLFIALSHEEGESEKLAKDDEKLIAKEQQQVKEQLN